MQLVEAWKYIEDLIDKGISVIPVYDKQKKTGRVTIEAKVPCEEWTEYQNVIVNKEFLYGRLEYFDTSAVAIVCGKVSGNLEVLDIDSKNMPGIEAEIFGVIKELRPDLYQILRVHKTQNSGFHILYRILGSPVPGSSKIAGRVPTEQEKEIYRQKNPKNKNDLKVVYFLETKGEGGYALAPPSMGYTIVRDVPVPVITKEDREFLINVCKNYNEVLKEPKIYKPTQADTEYYDENPFFHFSRVADPKEILEEFDWKFVSQKSKYAWFTRPGKDAGVSGSFNLETRCFFVFTSSSDLEESRGYFLANILALYKFDNDKVKTYKYLVDKGYGRIKPAIEERIIKNKALSYNDDLPPNLSEEGKVGYRQFKERLQVLHPFGIFWTVNENATISMNREKVYEISAKMGFRNYDEEVWRVENKHLLYKRSEREYYDTVKSYVKIEEDDIREKVLNSYETFIKDNGKFTMQRLQILSEDEILFDTRDKSFKFYQDCWIEITKNSVEKRSYGELDKVIFATKVQQRNYNPKPATGKYIEFLNLAVDLQIKFNYIKKVVGFLAHDYKDSAMGYIVILVEKVSDPKKGGGSGKNIFGQLFNYTTTYVSKPGEQANLNEKFLQSWNGERIFALSDLPKGFNFSFLKEFVTGTSILKKLFKDEKILPVERLPKIVCSTQFSFKITDGGLRRRLIPVEFSEFFTKMNGVDTYFGVYFPDGKHHGGFSEDDWSGYDWFITESIQEWMRGGLKLYAEPLSDTGWNKQFRQTYVDTIVNIIEQFWNKWVGQGVISSEDFRKDIEHYYHENDISPAYKVSMTKLNEAIEEYAKYNDVYYEKDFVANNKRCKIFKKLGGLNEKKQEEDKEEELPF